MRDLGRRRIALAVGLSALAGYVDAAGFLATGGLFVSFMSGNSTRLSVSLAQADFVLAGLILGVLGLFVLGVVSGSTVSRLSLNRPKTAVLVLVSSLLTTAAIFHSSGLTWISSALLILAMGAENAVFQRDGEVTVGLTYMTGVLVKLGQHLTSAFFGGPKLGFAPFALQWAGMVSGAVLGGLGHAALKSAMLWPAAGAAVLLCAASTRIRAASSS